jgi:hypothetical protein
MLIKLLEQTYQQMIPNIKGQKALVIMTTTLLTACGSSGSSSENNPNSPSSKVRAIANLDDYSQFEVTVKTTSSSCEPEYIGEAAEYDMRINNELGNIKIATGPRSGPDQFLLEGTRFGSNNLVLSGTIDTYAHRVDFDEIEILFQGADDKGRFTHLSANFDWSFGSGNSLCTGSSSIQGVKFDALDHFENSTVVPSAGVAEWVLGNESFTGETFTFWGQVSKGSQLLQLSSAQIDQGQNKSTSVTLSIARYTGPGTYLINTDEYNTVFVGQFDNDNFNNCYASSEYNNTSGTITVQAQGDELLVQYTAAMNCYSDLSLETYTNMENSTGSFTVDKDS